MGHLEIDTATATTTATRPTDVIVLAAGRGSRLGALGADRPKWLLDVGGETLADRHLDAVAAACRRTPGAVRSVRVVTGHASSAVARFLDCRDDGATVVENPAFDRLNNWYSLLLGLRSLKGAAKTESRILVINADLLAPVEWLSQFIVDAATSGEDALIGVDLSRRLTDESMKVAAEEPKAARLLLTNIGKAGVLEPVGEYVGVFAAGGEPLRQLESALASYEGVSEAGDSWYEAAIGDTARNGTPWVIWPTPDGDWVEIDDESDYAAGLALAGRG